MASFPILSSKSAPGCSIPKPDTKNSQQRLLRRGRVQSQAGETTGGISSLGPVVVNIPPPPPSTSPPLPAPVVHSPTYLYRAGVAGLTSLDEVAGESVESVTPEPVAIQPRPKKIQASNPLERALASADDMLNDLEQNPDSATQMIWNVSKSPAGQQAAKGVRNAADLTLKAGTEAVRLAIPLGTWALKKGFQLGMMLIEEGKKPSERKEEKEREE